MTLDTEFITKVYCRPGSAVAGFDAALRAVFWNARMEELTDMARGAAMGATAYDLFPQLPTTGPRDCFQQALNGSATLGEPPFVGARDSTRGRGVSWQIVPVAGRGRIDGVVLVAHVAVPVEGPSAEDTEQRFRLMADSSPVLLWMSGRDSNCTFFNNTWLQFSGKSLEEEYGVGWTQGVHPEDYERCMTTYAAAFSARESFEMEYRLRRHDGEYRWLLDRGTPRYARDGQFEGFIGSCVDITDRIRAEQSARAATEDLQRANEYMQRLLYAASHDLREPVRMVTSYVGLLAEHLKTAMDDTAREYVRFAVDGGYRMRELVDALLSLSRARAREIDLREVDVALLLGGVLEDLHIAVQEAGARIDVGEMPIVKADAALLRIVLSNLLSNAIKFRGDRAPLVSVRAQREAGEWVFTVADNGIGFEVDQLDRLFEMFTRLHPRHAYPGTGLGLALARDVVHRHGGRIWARSTPGEGSEFAFSLPVAP